MNFFTDAMLKEEEIDFRDEFRDFLSELDLSFVQEMDLEEKKSFPENFERKLGKNGYMGIPLPEKIGGRGLNMVSAILAAEEAGAIAFPLGCALNMSTYVSRPIFRYGTEEQVKEFVKPTLNGERYCGEAITEPMHGTDIAHLDTKAKKKDNFYVLKGEKRFQKGGFGADWFLVFARTNPEVKPHRGISAFIVEREDGIEIEKQFDLMGWRGMGASHLLLKNIEVPQENLVGEEGQGFEILQYLLQGERVLEASAAIGTARSSVKLAGKYADMRKQFGKKIKEFQGISFPLAEMVTRIEASKLLLLRAGRTIDKLEKRPNKEVSMAKFYATKTAWQAIDQSLQTLGGIGYTRHFPIEKNLRDVRVGRIYTGTNEIQKDIIRREFFRELREAEPEIIWDEWEGSRNLK